MARLIVENFSCIHHAELETAALTILIGPQASGKSVLSKLLYFFNDVLDDQPVFAEELINLDDFTKSVEENFLKSFPQQAWGPNAFRIIFESGPVTIKVQRGKPRKKSFGRLRWIYSGFFVSEYERLIDEMKAAREKVPGERVGRRDQWEVSWRVRRRHKERVQEAMSRDYVRAQLFVPAGRSFFTSMGKAVVAFEQGGYLDPLTIRFGRYFLSMRDFARAENTRRMRGGDLSSEDKGGGARTQGYVRQR